MSFTPGKGRSTKYAAKHQAERRARAARHHPEHPCVRCGKPLGPMNRNLHLDHAEDGTYLGFAHAACNRKAGASKGARIANALAKRTAGSGCCSHCKRPFARKSPAQRFCSPACYQATISKNQSQPKPPARVKLQPRLGVPAPPMRVTPCRECGTPTARKTFCSETCRARERHRETYQPKPRQQHEYTCACCGATCRSPSAIARFCSEPCAKRAAKRRAKGKSERSPILAPRVTPRTW